MIKKNVLGGINDTAQDAIERAKAVDLVTFPKDIMSTNCYNCTWTGLHKSSDRTLCNHPKVRQYVNARMVCSLWTTYGEYRPFKREEKFK
jgi:hypothetical protein